MKYIIHVQFDIEVDADNNLNAIEQVEKILFDGNVAHKAQPFLTYLKCRKQQGLISLDFLEGQEPLEG